MDLANSLRHPAKSEEHTTPSWGEDDELALCRPFFRELKKLFPQLSKEDMMLAGYIHFRFCASDISEHLNSDMNTVMHAQRLLKKTMGLTGDENLVDFIRAI